MKRILSILLSALMLFTLVGCGSSKTEEKKEEETFKISDRFPDGQMQLTAERNTDAAETEIYNIAKEDAEKLSDSTQIIKIVELIKNNSADPWKDNNTMEMLLYLGNLLDKSPNTTEEEKAIGFKTVATVKYVYRNEETKEEAQTTQQTLIKKLNNYEYLK